MICTRSRYRNIVVGVTGGIGAGKSLVADVFRRQGADVVDADEIARATLTQPAIKKKIVAAFGAAVLSSDGDVDRSKLAKRVFGVPDALKTLESIMHPVVIRAIRTQIQNASASIVIVDAPLLIESGMDREMDEVIVVTAPQSVRISRMKRKGISVAESRRRIAHQLSVREALTYATYHVRNRGTRLRLTAEVKKIYRTILTKYA